MVDPSPWLTLFESLLLPYGFVFALSLFEFDSEPEMPGAVWLVHFAWDNVVLSIGLLGGLTVNAAVQQYYGRAFDGCLLAGLLIDLLVIIILLRLRKRKPYTLITGLQSLAAGGASLGPVVYFQAHAVGIFLTDLLKEL